MARRFGATEAELDSLESLDESPFTEAERAAIRFAERLTREPSAIGADGVAALREHWSEEQAVEIACTAGVFNYLNRFAEAFGLHPTQPGEGGPPAGEAG